MTSKTKKLVVIIPAYDEEESIGGVIKNLPRNIPGVDTIKVLVIDDGSRDDTVRAARDAGADKIVSLPKNAGLGTAFSTGIETALKMGAGIIVNIDADGQFDPLDMPRLIEPIVGGHADFVTASRFLDRGKEPVNMPKVKKFGNRLFTSFVNYVTGESFTDTQCGYRAYSREAALRLRLFGRFTYTQEALLDLAGKGIAMKEIPSRVRYDKNRDSKVVKSVWSYGAKALIIMLRSIRDYKPLTFFGGIGLFVFSLGFLTGFGIFVRWAFTGLVSPYRSLVDASVLMLVMGFMLIMLAMIADMEDRQRKIQEEILYRLKKRDYDSGAYEDND